MGDVFAVKCDLPSRFALFGRETVADLTRYYGPFPTESAAKAHISVEKALNFCEGEHSIVQIREVESELNLTNWQVNSIIEDAKSRAVIEMARQSKPFVATWENDNTNIRVGITSELGHKIATIKELRNRYPGLGLKESKDIVDNWQEKGLVQFA